MSNSVAERLQQVMAERSDAGSGAGSAPPPEQAAAQAVANSNTPQPDAAERLLANARARREAVENPPVQEAPKQERSLSPQERLHDFIGKTQKIPLIYNGTLVERPAAEAIELMQIGLKAKNINVEKEAWAREKAGYGQFQELLTRARANPEVLRAINDIATGVKDPSLLYQQPAPQPARQAATPNPNGDDYEPETPPVAAPQQADDSRIAMLERQLANIKREQEQERAYRNAREYAQSREQAVSSDELLKGLPPHLRPTAELLVDSMVAAGDIPDPREAARVISAQFRDLAAFMAQREMEAREARSEAAAVPNAQRRGVVPPVYDREAFRGVTARDLRNRASPAHKEFVSRIAAAVRNNLTSS